MDTTPDQPTTSYRQGFSAQETTARQRNSLKSQDSPHPRTEIACPAKNLPQHAYRATSRWSPGLAGLCPKRTSCTTPVDTAPTAVVHIRLPWTKPLLSMNDRGASRAAMYAKAAKTKEIRSTVARLAQNENLPQNQSYAVVQLHYLPADNRRRDTDNLTATLKPICDGLAQDYGLVPDDIPAHMSKPEPIIHLHEKGQKPMLWLEITIWKENPNAHK